MLYTFSQAHYSETDFQRYLTEITENDAVIEGCKNKAKEFILLLNRSGMFKEISGDIPYSVFYDKLDVNVTGIVIQLKLEEIMGTVICNKSVKEIVYGSRN